jgi:hypothetical protein
MEKPSAIATLPAAPSARRINTPKESGRKEEKRSAILPVPTILDARRQPRFRIEVDIKIDSRTCGMLEGHTVDISESGIAAMLRIEVPLGEVVELDIALPCGSARVQAIGRQRNAFRYGFEFVDSNCVHELIRRTCRDRAIDQSLTMPDLR